MLKDKIIEIVKNLTHATNTGIIEWVEESPNTSTRAFKRKMVTSGEDGTKYEMEIKFQLRGEKWEIEEDPGLWVKNISLPDGLILISNYKSDNETIKLRDSIITNFCKDMNPTIEDVETVLGDIAKGINIAQFREGRLNKILN